MAVVRIGVRASCRGSGLDRSDSAQCLLSLHCEVPRYLIRRGTAANPPPGNFWQLPWAGTKSAWYKTKTSLSSSRTQQTALSPTSLPHKHSSVSVTTKHHGRLQEQGGQIGRHHGPQGDQLRSVVCRGRAKGRAGRVLL